MDQIGYSLVSENQEVQYWGDTPGQCVGVPTMLELPNGDQVHCPEVGEVYAGLRLVQRVFVYGAEAVPVVVDGKVVVTFPAPQVSSVTPRQARLALLNAGLLDAVEAAVAAGPKAHQITWDFATVVNRDDDLLTALGATLNLSSEQIDGLFTSAATF